MDTKNTQLCPNCKTGRDSYLLDGKAPFCPYINLHKGTSCSRFVLLKNNETEDE